MLYKDPPDKRLTADDALFLKEIYDLNPTATSKITYRQMNANQERKNLGEYFAS